MPFPARGGLFHSRGEAGAMPRFSILAGASGRQARMEEDRGVLPRDRQGRVGADRDGAGNSRWVPALYLTTLLGTSLNDDFVHRLIVEFVADAHGDHLFVGRWTVDHEMVLFLG